MQKVFMVIGHKDMFMAWLSLPLKIMNWGWCSVILRAKNA